MKHQLELRRANIPVTVGDVSAATNTVRVSGYAILYNQPSIELTSDGLTFREVILPGAFDAHMGEGADVRLLIEHDGSPLARTGSGTLQLRSDEKGIYFEADLDTSDPDVQRLVPKMKRGDLANMSFGFTADEGGDSYSLVDGEVIRSVEKGKLYELSAVGFPAYENSSVALRSATQIRAVLEASKVPEPANPLPLMLARARLRLAGM